LNHNRAVNKTAPISKERLAGFEMEALPNSDDLSRTALRLLREPAKASDAVQENYLLAWKAFDRYQRGTNCKAWLFRILFNVVRHERRAWFKWLTGENEDLGQLDQIAPEPISKSLSDEIRMNGGLLNANDLVLKIAAQCRK
jgi:DNA-directed RNA polymerase specialized sigma24 family protein